MARWTWQPWMMPWALLGVIAFLLGLAMVVLAWISSMPGACGNETGCTGGRDATPLTGIAVGAALLGASFAAARKLYQKGLN